jgi:hypothetical protein
MTWETFYIICSPEDKWAFQYAVEAPADIALSIPILTQCIGINFLICCLLFLIGWGLFMKPQSP